MKRIGIIFLLLVACLTAHAQQLNVKSVTLRRNDARARTNPRDDANGNKCAIIRVGVVGVEDLEFPDAVGKVEYSMNEYVVYVPDGLKKLKYKSKSNQYQGTVDFDYWGLEVNSQASYDVIFETDNHLRSAIFFITPTNATLTFNHKKVKLDKDGMATINMPPGEYYYMVEADGYQTQNGTVTLVEDDISASKHILLKQRKHQVTISVSPYDASVFVDDVPIVDNTKMIHTVDLSEGNHTIRVTAPEYEEQQRTINVSRDMTEAFSLGKMKAKVVKHKEEQSKININVRNANYFTIGGSLMGIPGFNDISNYGAGGITFEISRIYHFAGVMGMRFGAGVGLLATGDSIKNEKFKEMTSYQETDSVDIFNIDIPLQIGFSLPFGKYNQHMLNLYGGGYGRWWSVSPAEDKYEDLPSHNKFDFGIRLDALIDIGHFTIGAELNQSLNKMGLSVGGFIGLKIYRKNKE